MKRLLRAIATAVFIGLVFAPRSAHAQVYDVGSFVKPAANGNQGVPHTLGVAPKALILWTDGSTTGTGGAAHFWFAFGVSDGTTSRSVSAASTSGVNVSNTSRRSAAAALTIVAPGELTQADAVMQATPWDTNSFYLTWQNMSNASAWIIHFIAIGGSGVSASVVDWTAPAGTGTGPVSYSSLTFQPSVVLHFMGYNTAAVPSSVADAAFMLGVMDASGHQWATSFYSKDNQSSGTTPATTLTGKQQRTDAAILETNYTPTETLRAGFTSMDSNGFTVNFATNSVGAQHIFSLALSGVNLFASSVNRTTTCTFCTQAQPVTGVGFQPTAVLFASFSLAATTAPQAHAIFTFGAADSATRGMSGLFDLSARPLGGGSNKTFVNQYDWTTKCFGIYNSTGSIVAEATMSSLDADGFTLSWNPINFAGTEQINYLAFGALNATSVTLASFTATRLPDGKTRLEWRTGYEVDNVGFRLYREQNGKRVRITSSLVPGSAVIGAGRGMSTGGRVYSWSDMTVPSEAGPIQYWLEDVDLKGKSTWHGPIVPAAALPREPR